jgi:L-amino acid N-acyltransferase YncA
MTPADWPAVVRIYEAGIAGGNATFEPRAPSFEAWSDAHIDEPCLVARESSDGDGDGDGEVLGWAALGPISPRPVYRGVAEVSIYVDRDRTRKGVGRALLSALVESSERAGFWTLVAGIFPENKASIALHLACGFEPVGLRKRVGQMPGDGPWRDVVFYERRSSIVGVD